MAIPETSILESGEELSGDSRRRLRISERAHQLWVERGCPENSAESDWLDAERQIEDEEANGTSWSPSR